MKKCILLSVLFIGVLAVESNQKIYGHGGDAPPLTNQERILRALRAPHVLPDPGNFVNYQTPHVHPLDISPGGSQLAVVNTPDGHVELYDIDGSGDLTHRESIRVGMGPVTARFRSDTELWVVNQLSDSLSIIDTTTSTVTQTVITYLLTENIDGVLTGIPNGDEPADVVFATYAGTPSAIVSASRTDYIQIYDLADLTTPTTEIYLQGEEPRGLATANGNVYAAIFESGNSTTVLYGNDAGTGHEPNNTGVRNRNNNLDHPYYIDGSTYMNGNGGNSRNAFNPVPSAWVGPFAGGPAGNYTVNGTSVSVADLYNAGAGVGRAPTSSVIVRKDFSDNTWRDDNNADWTKYVSGDYSDETGRVFGWDMIDNDIAILPLDGSAGNELDNSPGNYAIRQMNICMALAINPANGEVYMVGTEATNEIRFEPVITGTFTRVMLSVTSSSGADVDLIDLNETHLDTAQGTAYSSSFVNQNVRNKSIGDPRGVAFTPDGATVYISGMGSNNVITLDTGTNARYTEGETIEVGFGPTGLAHHPANDRLYVVNKFDASVTVIDTTTAGSEFEVETLPFYDPTPDFINLGRVHFYGTHETSGLGQISCASCHVDGRTDRLAWDLGNPLAILEGGIIPTPADANFADIVGYGEGLLLSPDIDPNVEDGINALLAFGYMDNPSYEKFHPMKGPMATQTLQDIIGMEPFHWRGDKDGIEEFAGAFDGLQGADDPLNPTKMQEFEDFLSTIHFTPNPLRLLDNTLPGGPNSDGGTNANLYMGGFWSAPHKNGNLSVAGTPMEDAVPSGGDAWNGFKLFVDAPYFIDDRLDDFACIDCHSLPTGAGTTHFLNDGNGAYGEYLPFDNFTEIPPGPMGEAHLMVISNDATGQPHFKNPQLRNQLDKEGMFLHDRRDAGDNYIPSRAGFGELHDGTTDGVMRFNSFDDFREFNNHADNDAPPMSNSTTADETLSDITAFTLAINGDDFDYLFSLPGHPVGSTVAGRSHDIPPAPEEHTAHAGIGHTITISAAPTSPEQDKIYWMTRQADTVPAFGGRLDLVVTGQQSGESRSWRYASGSDAGTFFETDREGESTVDIATLLSYAGSSGAEMTFMVVPPIESIRRSLDRDEDTVYAGDELDYNTDSGNPYDHMWVDTAFGGTSDGSSVNPYIVIDDGLGFINPTPGKSAVLHLRVGNYTSSTTLFNTPMTIVAENGTATIDY